MGDGVPGAVDIATINCDDSDDNDDARMTVTVDNAKFEVVGSSPGKLTVNHTGKCRQEVVDIGVNTI